MGSLSSRFPLIPSIVTCSSTWVPTTFFSPRWHFPIVFYSSNFSQKTEFPQGVKDCGLLIFPCQCQEQCLTLGILGASGVFVAFI